MSTAPWRFTPKEVKRAKKALTESGLEIAAVIFRKDVQGRSECSGRASTRSAPVQLA